MQERDCGQERNEQERNGQERNGQERTGAQENNFSAVDLKGGLLLLPNNDTIVALAELFKMFGDPTRAKILSILQVKGMYVGELSEAMGMSISAISHQLRVLRSAKLVKGTKEGKEVKYTLDDDHVTKILQYGLTHVQEKK